MKRTMAVIIALALLWTCALPAMAALPDCFAPTTMMMGINTRLPTMFVKLGGAGFAAEVTKYILSNPEMLSDGMRFSNDDGNVVLEARGSSGGPSSPASRMTLTIDGSVNAMHATVLKQAFLSVVADSDKSVSLDKLLSWLSKASQQGDLNLGDYTLSLQSAGKGQSLILSTGKAPAAPTATPTATPAPTATPDEGQKSGLSEGRFADLFGGQKSGLTATPVPTPADTPEPTPRVLEGAVLAWNGLSLKPVKYNITAYSRDYVTMNLYFRVQNYSGQTLWVDVDRVTVDGNEEIRGTSIGKSISPSDTGNYGSNHSLIVSDTASGMQAIADARRVKLTIVLKDEHFSRLYTQEVSVDLTTLEGKRDVPEGFKAVDPTVTPKPAASSDSGKSKSSYTPSAADFKTLKPGNKGQAVRDLQQRLIDLGYLNDKADGSYGKKTTAAVRTFCEQNGLSTDGGNATPQMQARLFSSSAKAYSEPYIPLVIGSTCKYDPVKRVNTFFFKVQVINTSKVHTVKGFELNCYTTDVWGNKLDSGVVYSMSNKVTVRPGETAWSMNFNLGNWYSVDTVWVGISRIVFDDGEIRDVKDVEYYSCVMPDKK